MLVNLVRRIEHALVSYIKSVESNQSYLDFNNDFSCLIASTQKLKDHRRKDILKIHSICKQSLSYDHSPKKCIKNIYDYIMSMHTGFLFFPGQSKLRFSIIQAIEQYDIRYIQWNCGKALLVDNIFEISVNDALIASDSGQVWHDEQYISQLVQQRLDELTADRDSQNIIMRQHDETFDDMKKIIAELKAVLLATRNELAEIKMENMLLREQVCGPQLPTDSTQPESVGDSQSTVDGLNNHRTYPSIS